MHRITSFFPLWGGGLLLSSHSFAKITFIGNKTLGVDPVTHTVMVKRDISQYQGIINYKVTFVLQCYILRLKICLEKCVCWRQLHNVLQTKCIKSGGKSLFSLSFLFSTTNDVRRRALRRKLYTVGIQSTLEKRAKRMPETTVETTTFKVQIIIKIISMIDNFFQMILL